MVNRILNIIFCIFFFIMTVLSLSVKLPILIELLLMIVFGRLTRHFFIKARDNNG